MNIAQKILMLMGSFFTILGTILTIVFLPIGMAWIPLLFVIIGLAMICSVYLTIQKAKNIVEKGKKYTGKIYGYVENRAYLVNDSYTYNTRVRYFDEKGTKREAIINTAFPKGDGTYPIGMTMDISEYNGTWGFDTHSVRNEGIYHEKELMENKPIEPDLLNMVAIQCPNCGASFQAAAGYAEKCPYCDTYINA